MTMTITFPVREQCYGVGYILMTHGSGGVEYIDGNTVFPPFSVDETGTPNYVVVRTGKGLQIPANLGIVSVKRNGNPIGYTVLSDKTTVVESRHGPHEAGEITIEYIPHPFPDQSGMWG